MTNEPVRSATRHAIKVAKENGAILSFDPNIREPDVYKRQVLNNTNGDAWEQDSLEVFIDENNGKSNSYEDDDKQYRICLLYTSRCV